MNKLFTLACCAMGCAAVHAQTLVIHTKGATEPLLVPVADIEYMEVTQPGHTDMKELVEVKVKNLGRFSFDVEVKKSADCVQYVVGALTSKVYNEDNFIEAAIQTLDENAFFRPYRNAIGTGDQTFAERQLGINVISNYDKDDRAEVYTTVAVCAFAKDGSYKVYTQEFIAPDPVVEDTPTATITTGKIGTENFAITIEASDDCKKIIYGITSPEGLNGSPMSEKTMLSSSQNLPVPYTSAMTFNANEYEALHPGSTYYVYVIPVAADGTLGHMTYTTVKTQEITADGTGLILTAQGTLQVEGQYKTIAFPKMTFNDAVEKVRVMWCSETDFSGYKGRLAEVFGKPTYNNMAWNEYDINALPRTLNVYHYGDKYYMYAATVDKDGLVSDAQDVLALMGKEGPYITNNKSDFVPDMTFDGTATAVIVNDDKEVKYSPYIPDKVIETNPYFTITPGENLSNVLIMRVDNDVEDVEKAVEAVLVGYPNYCVGENGVKCELTYINNTWTIAPQNSLDGCTVDGKTLRFKETWLSYEILVFVTVDNNGRPRIAFTYDSGDGVLKEYK